MHPTPHHRHSLRPAARRLLAFTLAACAAAGGVSFLLSRHAAIPSASAASVSSTAAEAAPASGAASAVEEEPGLLSAQQAQAMLDDPRMVLVNHTNKMPEDYTFTTRECGSATAVNKTLQTEAADAFLAMQAAAAREGVTIWMQSGYRSVKYQEGLYSKKTVLSGQGAEPGRGSAEGRFHRESSGLLRAQLRPCLRPEQPGAHRP